MQRYLIYNYYMLYSDLITCYYILIIVIFCSMCLFDSFLWLNVYRQYVRNPVTSVFGSTWQEHGHIVYESFIRKVISLDMKRVGVVGGHTLYVRSGNSKRIQLSKNNISFRVVRVTSLVLEWQFLRSVECPTLEMSK